MAKPDKTAMQAEREKLFDALAGHTPLVSVETRGAVYVVPTDDTIIGRQFFIRRRRPEMSVLARCLDLLREMGLPDPTTGAFVDVGANVGTTTIPAMVEHGFRSAVAIEAAEDNARLLRANVALNGLEDRVTVLHAGASNRSGEMIVARGKHTGAHQVVAEGVGDAVTVGTLDELVPDDVGLLWMDVQGHEGHVLDGASRLMAAGVPVVFEYWPVELEEKGGLELLRTAISGYTHVIRLRGKHDTETPWRYTIDTLPELDEALDGRFTDLLAVRAPDAS